MISLKRIHDVIDYMENNLDQELYIGYLASRSYVSKYHFQRLFKAVTGQSVHQFITRMRLEKAVQLLNSTEDTIQVIANQCGYETVSALSKVFKKYKGISPGNYRKCYQ